MISALKGADARKPEGRNCCGPTLHPPNMYHGVGTQLIATPSYPGLKRELSGWSPPTPPTYPFAWSPRVDEKGEIDNNVRSN